LFIVHPPPELASDPSKLEVEYVSNAWRVANNTLQRNLADQICSIVAVHGLNGTVRKTWTDADSGKFWLEDFLPKALPKARIMTFGYDSGLAFSRSKAGIENFARDLLNRLRMLRSSHEVLPLIRAGECYFSPYR
jgi:hypothetical protein